MQNGILRLNFQILQVNGILKERAEIRVTILQK